MSTSIPSTNFYEILGVSKTADKDELRKSYKKLVLKWHPDKNPDNLKVAEQKFKDVQEAYNCLTDDIKRINYDRWGHPNGPKPTPPPPPPKNTSSSTQNTTQNGSQNAGSSKKTKFTFAGASSSSFTNKASGEGAHKFKGYSYNDFKEYMEGQTNQTKTGNKKSSGPSSKKPFFRKTNSDIFEDFDFGFDFETQFKPRSAFDLEEELRKLAKSTKRKKPKPFEFHKHKDGFLDELSELAEESDDKYSWDNDFTKKYDETDVSKKAFNRNSKKMAFKLKRKIDEHFGDDEKDDRDLEERGKKKEKKGMFQTFGEKNPAFEEAKTAGAKRYGRDVPDFMYEPVNKKSQGMAADLGVEDFNLGTPMGLFKKSNSRFGQQLRGSKKVTVLPNGRIRKESGVGAGRTNRRANSYAPKSRNMEGMEGPFYGGQDFGLGGGFEEDPDVADLRDANPNNFGRGQPFTAFTSHNPPKTRPRFGRASSNIDNNTPFSNNPFDKPFGAAFSSPFSSNMNYEEEIAEDYQDLGYGGYKASQARMMGGRFKAGGWNR